MVDLASDRYAVDINRARKLLDWEPQRSLRKTLPRMIEALKEDPAGWYRANKLNAAKVADRGGKARERAETLHAEHDMTRPGHMVDMAGMGQQILWAHFLVITLGIWLLTSPLQFALFDPAAAGTVPDVTQEPWLLERSFRILPSGVDEMMLALLLMVFRCGLLLSRFVFVDEL